MRTLKQDPSQKRIGDAISSKIAVSTAVQFINKVICERPINTIKTQII
jgi:hypothetical protein